MINRLAVILLGQYRTFDITHKYLFDFFRNKADNVDYFFVTWPTSGGHNTRYYEQLVDVTNNDILKCFGTVSLAGYKILNDIPKKHTYYRMAYLSAEGAKLKKQVENKNQFVYDQVVETRPDVYLRLHPYVDWQLCLPLEYGGHSIEIVDNHLFMNDCYIRSDSRTHDIIASRISIFDADEVNRPGLSFGEKYGHDHHSRLAGWLIDNNIVKIQTPDYQFINVVRDPMLGNLNLDTLTADQLNGNSFDYTENNLRPKFISVYHNVEPQEFTATHNMFVEAHSQSIFDSLHHAVKEIEKNCAITNQQYNWVRFIQNTKDNPDNFFRILPKTDPNIIYSFDSEFYLGNFYCSPNIFKKICQAQSIAELSNLLFLHNIQVQIINT